MVGESRGKKKTEDKSGELFDEQRESLVLFSSPLWVRDFNEAKIG